MMQVIEGGGGEVEKWRGLRQTLATKIAKSSEAFVLVQMLGQLSHRLPAVPTPRQRHCETSNRSLRRRGADLSDFQRGGCCRTVRGYHES
jgi:hypothetical protein